MASCCCRLLLLPDGELQPPNAVASWLCGRPGSNSLFALPLPPCAAVAEVDQLANRASVEPIYMEVRQRAGLA